MFSGVYAVRDIFADRASDVARRVLDDLCCMLHAMFNSMGTLRYSVLRCVDTLQYAVVDDVHSALGRALDSVRALHGFVSEVLCAMFNSMDALCDFMGGGATKHHTTFCCQLGYFPARG